MPNGTEMDQAVYIDRQRAATDKESTTVCSALYLQHYWALYYYRLGFIPAIHVTLIPLC